MVDLTKFTEEDLKKSFLELGQHLKGKLTKADMTSFDPRETEEKPANEEEKLGGESKKMPIPTGEGKETKKEAVKKEDFPPENGNGGAPKDESMTETSQTDVLAQILQILQELKAKMNPPAPAPVAPTPNDQVQLSATAPTPQATPSTTPSKSDININVTKSIVEDVLKGMGITPTPALTPKPKVDS